MICALMMGRAGSTGFPEKNIKKVLGRHLFEYPLIASKNSKYIDKIFVSTDCPIITRVSKNYCVIQIKRPKRLANNKALGEHVYEHGYFEIKKMLNLDAENIEFIERFRALLDEYKDRTSVGEISNFELMALYTEGKKKLHMAYSFELLGPIYTANHFRQSIEDFLNITPKGWACWSFSNHDVIRHVSRWIEDINFSDNLAKQAASSKVKRFIYASSIYSLSSRIHSSF